MRVRLTKKLAAFINGIDLTYRHVGEIFACPEFEGRLLVLEGWAETTPDDLEPPLENAEQSGYISQFIEDHRDGKKDRLA